MDEIIEMFSTYLGLGDSNGRLVIRQVSDSELATHITSLLQFYPDANAEFFARKFLKDLRQFLRSLMGDIITLVLSNPGANTEFVMLLLLNALRLCLELRESRHLVVFLQHIGKISARRVYRRWQNRLQLTQLYTQQDFYQIAWSIASNPAKFFRKFKFPSSLTNYARSTMERKINDEIFPHLGLGAHMCSDWGLLRRESRSFLKEALQTRWSEKQLIDCYLSARDCFNQIYAPHTAPGSHSLSKPTVEQFQAMADLYNQLVQPATIAGSEDIRQWLNECIIALRLYRQIDITSIDTPSSSEEYSPPFCETIPDRPSHCQWERLNVQEPAEQFMAVLPQFLATIPENHRQLLLLKCGCGLSFRLIAPFFGVVPSTVNHRYNTAKQALLNQVAQWATQMLGVSSESYDLEEISARLEECLKKYYQDFVFRSVLQNALSLVDCQYRTMLHLRYFRQMNEADIACQLPISRQEVVNGLATSSQSLESAIASWLQNHIEAPPDLLMPVPNWITKLVQTLVETYLDHNFISTEKEKCQQF